MVRNIGWNITSLAYDFFTGKVDLQVYEDVLSSLGPLDGVRIDEFGCGTGNLTRRFPETARVRAIDYSPVAIAKAMQKTNERVNFFSMNFYEEQPGGESPDKIVACRSLYHPDLSRSLGILSNHLGESGEAVILHPIEDWKKYVMPKVNGRRRFDPIQLVKASARISNRLRFPYALFSREEFENVGMQHFDEVSVGMAAYDTHYLVQLRNGSSKK